MRGLLLAATTLLVACGGGSGEPHTALGEPGALRITNSSGCSYWGFGMRNVATRAYTEEHPDPIVGPGGFVEIPSPAGLYDISAFSVSGDCDAMLFDIQVWSGQTTSLSIGGP